MVLTASYAKSLHFAYLKRLPVTSPAGRKKSVYSRSKRIAIGSIVSMVSHIEVPTQELRTLLFFLICLF